MAGTFVQAVANSANTGYVNISPTAGNTIQATCDNSTGSGNGSVTSISLMSAANGGGSVLGTLTIPAGLNAVTGGPGGAGQFYSSGYLVNIPAGVQSILFAFNGGGTPGTCNILASEVSGLSAFLAAIWQSQTNPGTGVDAISSTTVAIGSIPAYLLGTVLNGGDGDTVAGTNFTARFPSTANWFVEDRRETTATGSYAALARAPTHGGTDTYGTILMAFSEPALAVASAFYLKA